MTSMDQPSAILCFGCKERFSTLEDYIRHQQHAEHIDKGETWVSA